MEPSLVELAQAEDLGAEPEPGTGPGRRVGHEPLAGDQVRDEDPHQCGADHRVRSGGYFLAGLETFAELYFRDRYGVSQSLASLLFVVVACGALGGVLLSGRTADRMIRRGHTTARMTIGAVAYVATAVIFVPGALSPSLVLAVPILLVAAGFVGAANPPVDAARLDIMPSLMWGRAEAVRTALRQFLQGLAPLLFGLVSVAFGGSSSGLGAGVNTQATRASSASAHGLELTFIVLTAPLVLAGAALTWMSRRAYLREIVAARRSDENWARTPAATP